MTVSPRCDPRRTGTPADGDEAQVPSAMGVRMRSKAGFIRVRHHVSTARDFALCVSPGGPPTERSCNGHGRTAEFKLDRPTMSNLHRRRPDEPVEVLLVEDNLGDIRLTQEAFEGVDSETKLHPVTDGDDALEFLTRRADDDAPSLPDIVLLDLNLPGRDGCEVLEAIRDDRRLHTLPVLMLTSSGDSRDIERCYGAHANAYLTKPTDIDEFASLVKAVEGFWFERATLPPVPK